MKRLLFIKIFLIGVGLLLMPVAIHAQSGETKTENPPIEQPLVREGNLAIKLVEALKIGTTTDETEAESMLGSAGIAPRNGWIADYPVTPDIIGELRSAVSDSADSKRLSMGKDEASKAFQDATVQLGLEVKPYSGETQELKPSSCENYPNPSVINNYYYDEGPPVVTYYPPPPDYYYLYAWVPYPFWWFDFWFPGFFILQDFHKVVIVNKKVVFITNHFNDFKNHRVFRIDPVQRFGGKTFAGIAAPSRRGFISTGSQRGAQAIFNRSRERAMPGGRTFVPPSGGGRATIRPPEGRTITPPSGEGRTITPPSSGGRALTPPSGGRPISPPPGGGRTISPPSGGGRGSFERGQRR